jgi:MFS family permease
MLHTDRMASMLLDRSQAPTRAERPTPRWAPSPSIGAAEIAWVIAAGVTLAVLTTWPLLLHLGSRIAPDLGDPIRTAWEVAWVGHALLHQPLHLFDANAFYPHRLSLAFSDSLLGYGPAGWLGSGTVAALVRYNLLFLLAWSLCFVGAYLLARELGTGRVGGAVAGGAFAYAPYRITEAGHLHVISGGGIPLALFLLLRGYRRRSRVLVSAGWLLAAWQISLGFTLGLQLAYLMAVLALIVFYWGGRAWGRAVWRSLSSQRALSIITCFGIVLCGLVTAYEARPYLRVASEYPTAKRTLREVENYSSGPWALLSASSENRVWGGVTAGARSHVHSQNEDVFFPGALIFLLALLGLFASVYTRRLRIGLACGVVVCSVLAMGMGLTGAGYPYRLLYDYAPGWEGVRVPGRVFIMATLFLALLAAAGGWRLAQLARAWSGGLGPRAAAGTVPAVGALLVIGLVGEGAGHMAHPVVPQPVRAEAGLPAPVLDLPTDGASDRLWQYFSVDGFYTIPVGNSTFDLPALDDLRGGLQNFPDQGSVQKLRYYGIKTVVLHTTMPRLPGLHAPEVPEPPDYATAALKPIAGLGITRRRVGSIVIYEIGPGPKALHAS